MFYLVDTHGEALGQFATRDQAVAAMDDLCDLDAAAEVAVIEVDGSGRRVGEPITHVHA